MVGRQRLEPYARPPPFEARHIAQHLARSGRGVSAALEQPVQLAQPPQEGVERQLAKRRRHQILYLDVALLEPLSGGSGHDQQLAGDVASRQIGPRVWLGVAARASFGEQRGERDRAVVCVEEERERAGEHAGERDQGIAGAPEPAQRRERRESGPDRGGVAVARASGFGPCLQRLPFPERAAGGALGEWEALQAGAEAGGTRYGDAATVGAGLPALSTLRRLRRAGDTLVALTGVFSGSLSFLFNAYDGTVAFSSLLAEARARGYTEPDPRADLSGRDVARKLLIVARAAGERLEEGDIEVEDLVPAPLRELTLEAFLVRLGELDGLLERRRYAAAASGQVLRYVARLERGRASIRLEALAPDHPCAQLSGADNLFAFTTRRYHLQPLVVRGPGAGPEITAQALLADVLEIVA